MNYYTQDFESANFIAHEEWEHLSFKGFQSGVSSGLTQDYPGLGIVYNYEMHSGGAIASTWCLKSELNFSRAMAFAAAVKWEDELQDLIAII